MEGFTDNLQYLMLIFARMFGLMAIAPVFSTQSVGGRTRAILAILLAIIAFPVAANHLPPLPNSPMAFMAEAAAQVAIGLAIGFLMQAVFAAFQLLGELFSIQMGISFSEVLDPQAQISIPLLGTLQNAIGVLIFLYVPFQMADLYAPAYLHLIHALALSFRAVPTLIPDVQTLGGLAAFMDQAFGIMFVTAIKIGIPMIGILFISSLMLGLLGRAAPQMNLIAMGIQVNITVGLVVLMTLIPVIVPLMLEAFREFYMHTGEMLRTWPATGAIR